MNTKYIFVTGGVASSLGKGIIAASLANNVTTGRIYTPSSPRNAKVPISARLATMTLF